MNGKVQTTIETRSINSLHFSLLFRQTDAFIHFDIHLDSLRQRTEKDAQRAHSAHFDSHPKYRR